MKLQRNQFLLVDHPGYLRLRQMCCKIVTFISQNSGVGYFFLIFQPSSYIVRDTGAWMHDGALLTCLLKGGEATRAKVPLHKSIISNFMIYQDRLETNLLQLSAHT